MKHYRLSAIFVAAAAATLLMASTSSFAGHKAHKASEMSYKGENFKAEVPAPCPPAMVLRDGFYLGLGASYDAFKIKQDTTINGDEGDVNTFKINHGLTGWDGTAFAGYGMYFDTFYLGAELGATVSNANSSMNVSDVDGDFVDDALQFKLKARTSYNVALLPGLKVNDSTLLYVRVGYMRTQFKASATVFEEGVALGTASKTQWENGINYGVGVETYLAENISARAEYTYTSYSSEKLSHSFQNVEFGNTKLSPSNNQFVLGLIYHI